MSAEPTNADKLRALPWDVGWSAANSVFSQFTFFGSLFVLFLSELGLSKTAIGSLLSLLPFTGLIALFVALPIARFGYKRTFLLFWGVRAVAAAFLLLTPWVMSQAGPDVTLLYIASVVAAFAISRSVGMTARLPWVQEFVPDSVRGKFSALSNIFSQSAAFVSVIVAGYVIERSAGLGGFTLLFGVGVVFGLASVWAASHVPGGAPARSAAAEESSYRGLLVAARDRNFVRFNVGVAFIILAAGPLASFLPLFMQEKVGLSTGSVVWLQNGTLLGGLLSSYFWGWLADRYGSKPVMMTGVYLRILLPIMWLAMPKQTDWSLYVALGIALVQGFASLGWQIGSMRLRFVSVIPEDKKRDYLALYFAWIGIVGGIGQLVGGWLLDVTEGLSGQVLGFSLDSYSVLFIISCLLPIAAVLLFRDVRADSSVSTGEFAAMFFQGNPFMAMESLIRYHRARGERATVSMTERLGRTESPLTVDELLEALSDPRFYVRFEAIVSIARRGPDERLMEALILVLKGHEPALSTISAWALGRIRDERALEPLREGLGSRYRSVQAHCARALGTLNDPEVGPILLERLETETDAGLQLAYASALGKLGERAATERLLALLRVCEDRGSCRELALALARLVGDEHHFVQLLRRSKEDMGTTTSQAVSALRKTASELQIDQCDLLDVMDACAAALARSDLERGGELLSKVIDCLPMDQFDEFFVMILQDCADRLREFGMKRAEYTHLALHALHVMFAEKQRHVFSNVFG